MNHGVTEKAKIGRTKKRSDAVPAIFGWVNWISPSTAEVVQFITRLSGKAYEGEKA